MENKICCSVRIIDTRSKNFDCVSSYLHRAMSKEAADFGEFYERRFFRKENCKYGSRGQKSYLYECYWNSGSGHHKNNRKHKRLFVSVRFAAPGLRGLGPNE